MQPRCVNFKVILRYKQVPSQIWIVLAAVLNWVLFHYVRMSYSSLKNECLLPVSYLITSELKTASLNNPRASINLTDRARLRLMRRGTCAEMKRAVKETVLAYFNFIFSQFLGTTKEKHEEYQNKKCTIQDSKWSPLEYNHP